jgi:hypothetical protein
MTSGISTLFTRLYDAPSQHARYPQQHSPEPKPELLTRQGTHTLEAIEYPLLFIPEKIGRIINHLFYRKSSNL